MSARSERLAALLAELGSGASVAATGPDLAGRRGLDLQRGAVLARRDEREDPLTGHRGVAEGLHLLLKAGRWLVDLQLRDEQDGVVLRGQLLPTDSEAGEPSGALVHARIAGRTLLACVDSAGEFVLRGLPAAALESLHLELEDGVHDLPWPDGAWP